MPLGPTPERKRRQREWREKVAALPPAERAIVRQIELAHASVGTRADDLAELERGLLRLEATDAIALVRDLKEMPQ